MIIHDLRASRSIPCKHWKCDELCEVRKDNSTVCRGAPTSATASICCSFAYLISFTRRRKLACSFAGLRSFPFALARVFLGYRFMMLAFCVLYDNKLLVSTRAALTLHQRKTTLSKPRQADKVVYLVQWWSLAFPHRLGPAHGPRARTQPSKHNQSQSTRAVPLTLARTNQFMK